ncbi:F-box domain-containing, partial [Fusarium albosuccineum]
MSSTTPAASSDTHDSCSEGTWVYPPMLRLPPELVDMIFQFLGGEVQVCFALTCRTLYNDYFLKTFKGFRGAENRYSNKGLLCLLEKDSPGSYYCSHCYKLHRWGVPKREARTHWEEWKGDLSPHCYFRGDDTALEFEVGEYHRLTFHAVRVVMNRHLYGPVHGMPLQDLELDTHHQLCRESGASLE